jgi:AAA15 family ATPase/GTPase
MLGIVDVEVTVSNYRCFADTPVRFALKKGLQSFVGVNNSGKSCLLRLFYELRSVFMGMSSPTEDDFRGTDLGTSLEELSRSRFGQYMYIIVRTQYRQYKRPIPEAPEP